MRIVGAVQWWNVVALGGPGCGMGVLSESKYVTWARMLLSRRSAISWDISCLTTTR
jgi:hypothetical protein